MPTKKKTTATAIAKPAGNLHGLAKAGYMYLATFLGLVALALGATGLINVAMEMTVLPPAIYDYEIRSAISNSLNVVPKYLPSGGEQITAPTMSEAQAAVQKANEHVNSLYKLNIAERNRALSLSLVFVLVGGVIYLFHRKETLNLVKKD